MLNYISPSEQLPAVKSSIKNSLTSGYFSTQK